MLDAFPPIPAVGRAPVPKDFASSPIAARLGEDKTSTFREVRVPPAHGRAGKDDSGFDDWKKRTDNLAAAVLAAARVWRAPGSPPAKPMDNAATPAAESSNAHQDTEQDEGRRGNGHTHVPSSYMHEEQHQATADQLINDRGLINCPSTGPSYICRPYGMLGPGARCPMAVMLQPSTCHANECMVLRTNVNASSNRE